MDPEEQHRFRQDLMADPEFGAYLATIGKTVAGATLGDAHDYATLEMLLGERLIRDGLAHLRVAEIMVKYGFDDDGQLAKAPNDGEIELSEDDIEALLIADVMQ